MYLKHPSLVVLYQDINNNNNIIITRKLLFRLTRSIVVFFHLKS